MKKTILSIIMAAFAAIGAVAQTPADTVFKFSDPLSVTISENAGGVTVSVLDSDTVRTVISRGTSESGTRRSRQQYNRISAGHNWDVVSGGIMLGFNSTPSADFAPEMGKSLEIGWLRIVALQRRFRHGWNLSLGVGIDWRNYRSTTGTMYVADGGKISASAFSPGTDYRFSRIKIFSLQFPLLATKYFGRSSLGYRPSFSFGPVFNWNSHGSVLNSWRDADGTVYKTSDKHIGQRKFTIDLMAQLSMGPVGVYVRYSPYKVLTGATAPDFHSLSAGFSFFY